MKSCVISVSAFLASIVVATAADVDWKFYGSAEDKQHCFYDAQGVTFLSVGHPRVWTKCLNQDEMETAAAAERDQNIIKRTGDKIISGYLPL
jgi:hypothetical protein